MFAHKPNTQINKLSENMFFNNIFWKLSTIQQHSRHVYVRHLNHVNYKQSLSRFISFKNFKEKKNNDFEVGLDFKKLNPFIKFPFLFY